MTALKVQLLVALLLLPSQALHAEDDPEPGSESDREDELFGETPSALPAATLGDQVIQESLRDEDKRLVLGGQLYLRANAALPEEASARNTTLASPNLLDLFVDARPNDLVRGFAQARMVHDWTVEEGDIGPYGTELQRDKIILDQLFLNMNVHGHAFVTAGQQRLKWGAGRFWNPTDFLDPARLDPLAFFDERTGVPLLKVHVPSRNVNLYAVGDFSEASRLNRVGGALRGEFLVGLTELALSAALRKGDPIRLGGQLTTGLGPLDLKGELTMLHGVKTPAWEGSADWESGVFPTEVSLEEDWIPQAVGGAELGIKYNDQDAAYLGVEYFYNGSGYESAELYPWLLFQGQFEPFYLGRHYGGLYLYLPAPGRARDWNFVLSTLGNLSDSSYVSRLDVSVQALTKLKLNLFGQWHFGEPGEFRFAMEVPPIPGYLEQGISVPSPLLDLGLGASVEF